MRRRSAVDRLVSAFLLVLMALGSFALWIVVPAACLRLLLPLVDSTAYHLMIGLLGVPTMMILAGLGLFWLNGLYLRVNGFLRIEDPDEPPVRLRGPLEPLLIWSLLVAVVAIMIWFFFFAQNPAVNVV